MSAQEYERNGAPRTPASHTVAGYLAAAAIFAGIAALVYYPGRIGPAAMFTSLLAAAMGGSHGRLAAFSVAVATLGWLLGMVIAVFLDKPII